MNVFCSTFCFEYILFFEQYCHGSLVLKFVIAVKQSTELNISSFPAFGSSKNISLAASTFTNWNIFPFDAYTLPNSMLYLDGLFRVCGSQSPRRMTEDDEDENDDWIIRNTSKQIKPSDALTPSIGPMNQSEYEVDNDSDVSNMDDDDFLI